MKKTIILLSLAAAVAAMVYYLDIFALVAFGVAVTISEQFKPAK